MFRTSCMILLTGAALSLVLATPAGSQVVEKKTLTLDGAERVILAARAEAKRQNCAGVIAVVDDGGNLVALSRLDGTFPAGAMVSIGKARTAALFRRPTSFFEDVIRNGRTAMTALPDFTPLQGGVPIEIAGQIVGAVGVSGASSAAVDDTIAHAAAAIFATPEKSARLSGTLYLALASALVGSPPARASESNITYFRAEAVAASFAKGAVLYNPGTTSYMVHTSRRAAPGMAEVHALDTDIIYVLEGSATFVTGGVVIDGKTTAPDEIRGASIEGGETRLLSPGDVIIVPNNTPHWFREVRGPVLYYTIKVR